MKENEYRLGNLQRELEEIKANKKKQIEFFDKEIAVLEKRIVGHGDWANTREVLGLAVFTFDQLRKSLGDDIRYQRRMGRYKSEEYIITDKDRL